MYGGYSKSLQTQQKSEKFVKVSRLDKSLHSKFAQNVAQPIFVDEKTS
jgi:hypothetical protein